MSILGHHPKGALEGVVYLMHLLVHALVVHQLVDEVVPGVLQDQAAKQLSQEDVPVGGGGGGGGWGH